MGIFVVPQWFLGYDTFLEAAFAIVAFLVSWYALKISRLSGHRQPELFGIGFLLIAVSYLMKSILNIFLISGLWDNALHALGLSVAAWANGVWSLHMTLFLAGLVTLAYMTARVKRPSIVALLGLLVGGAILLSSKQIFMSYVMAAMLLGFVAVQYGINAFEKKSLRSFMTALAFFLILVGSIQFIFSLSNGLFYVVGHALELVAYMIILGNLILVLRHDKKTG